jgi:hypothetical protein
MDSEGAMRASALKIGGPRVDIAGMRTSDLELARAAHATLLTELKNAEARLPDLPTGSAASPEALAEVEAIRGRIARLLALFGASLRINAQE